MLINIGGVPCFPYRIHCQQGYCMNKLNPLSGLEYINLLSH